MERKRLCRSVAWLAARRLGGVAGEQRRGAGKPGSGKTRRQTFASDCAVCHKSPQGLAKSRAGFSGSKASCASTTRRARSRPPPCQLSAGAGQRTADRAPSAPPKAISQNQNEQKKASSRSRPRPKGLSTGLTEGAETEANRGSATPSRPTGGRPRSWRRSADAVEPRPNSPAAGEAKPADGAGE